VTVRSDVATASFTLTAASNVTAGTSLDSHSVVACNGTGTTCDDTGLVAGTKYYYFTYGRAPNGAYALVASSPVTTGPIVADMAGGAPRSIAISGDVAVVSQQGGGLLIADISALPNITVLGRYASFDWIIHSAVESGYVFIANGNSGLTIIDIHNPAKPVWLSTLSFGVGGAASSVVKDGNIAYVCDTVAGVVAVDVSELSAPKVLSTSPIPAACTIMQKSGNYLYVASSADGLNIYSLSQPSTPTLVRNVPTATATSDVLVNGSYAYLSAGTGGVRIVDVSSPASAAIVATFAATSSVVSVSSDGNYLYVSESTTGLRVVDASNPVVLSQVGVYAGKGPGAFYSAKIGNYIIDAGAGFLEVVDVSTPAAPTLSSSVPGGAALSRASYSNNIMSFAFTGTGFYGATIDSNGKFTPTTFLPGYSVAPGGTFSANSLLYVAAGNGNAFSIYDPSVNPPTYLGGIAAGALTSVHVEGHTAYLMGGNVRIVDVTTPATPTLLSTLVTAGANNTAVQKAGNFLYISDSNGNVRVVNVSNPAAPTLATTALAGTYNVRIKGTLLAVTRQMSGVTLYDISTPGTLTPITTITGIGDVRAVAFHDHYMLTAAYNTYNFCVFDITNPSNPIQLANVPVAGVALTLDVDDANETVMVGIRGSGIMSLKAAFP
jgi:hypothetical protein